MLLALLKNMNFLRMTPLVKRVADFPFKSLRTIDNKPLNCKDNVRNALRKNSRKPQETAPLGLSRWMRGGQAEEIRVEKRAGIVSATSLALRKQGALTRPNKCPLMQDYCCHLASKRPSVILRISGVKLGEAARHLKLNVPATILFCVSNLVMFTVPVSVLVVAQA